MKGKRFSQEQVIAVLEESEAGREDERTLSPARDLRATFYNWKTKHAGMTVSEARRLRELEAEESKLKRLPAEAELDTGALKDLPGRNGEPAGAARSGGDADERARLRCDACVRAGADLSVAIRLPFAAVRLRAAA